MKTEKIKNDFRKKVSGNIDLFPLTKNKFLVTLPLYYSDGDHYRIILKKFNDKYILTDEGNTFLRLSYDSELKSFINDTRLNIINKLLSVYMLTFNNGEISIEIENNDFEKALYTFIQGIIRINDISFLKREIVRSVFMKDFKYFLKKIFDNKKLFFNYFDPEKDPAGNYLIDCKYNYKEKNIFFFGIQNNTRCRDATITCLQYEKWKFNFNSIAIFEEQENISRKVLARFSDVTDKQFSSLYSNQDRILQFIEQKL